MTLYNNASNFIPLTTIPLTDFPLFNTTGLAEIRLGALESDLSRRNQMQAEGAGKTGELLYVSARAAVQTLREIRKRPAVAKRLDSAWL